MSPQIAPHTKVIAIDFDDTITKQTEFTMRFMKETHGIELTMDDFESRTFFHVRGFGDPADVSRKLAGKNTGAAQPEPQDGLRDSIKALRSLGYELHIVTATGTPRSKLQNWLADVDITLGPGMDIEDVHYARQPEERESLRVLISDIESREDLSEEEKRLNLRKVMIDDTAKNTRRWAEIKLGIMDSIGASMFIDDIYLNFVPVLEKSNIQCLLFGNYRWSIENVDFSHPNDYLTYAERESAGVGFHFRPIEEGDQVHKVKDWQAVVAWVKNWEANSEEKGEKMDTA